MTLLQSESCRDDEQARQESSGFSPLTEPTISYYDQAQNLPESTHHTSIALPMGHHHAVLEFELSCDAIPSARTLFPLRPENCSIMALASKFARSAPSEGPAQARVFRPDASLISLSLVLRALQYLDIENVNWVLDGNPDRVYDVALCDKMKMKIRDMRMKPRAHTWHLRCTQ